MASGYFCLIARCCCIRGVSALVLTMGGKFKEASTNCRPMVSHGDKLLPLFMRKLGMDELKRKSVDEFRGSEKKPVIVVLDNIRSMHNVGSVFRSADAFLIQAIFLCGYTPRPPHRDIHKTALGATETVEWKYAEKSVDAVKSLKTSGYQIVGVEQVTGSIPLQQFKLESGEKMVLIFGNEVEGVSEEVLSYCNG